MGPLIEGTKLGSCQNDVQKRENSPVSRAVLANLKDWSAP